MKYDITKFFGTEVLSRRIKGKRYANLSVNHADLHAALTKTESMLQEAPEGLNADTLQREVVVPKGKRLTLRVGVTKQPQIFDDYYRGELDIPDGKRKLKVMLHTDALEDLAATQAIFVERMRKQAA